MGLQLVLTRVKATMGLQLCKVGEITGTQVAFVGFFIARGASISGDGGGSGGIGGGGGGGGGRK